LTFETGRIARQASASVLVQQRDTVVLVTLVVADSPREGADFFPLTVEYRARMAAGGRIPGAYGRREGRMSTEEVLTSRMIDRSLRPLFPDGFRNEVQVTATVLSQDPEVDSDVLALAGAGLAAQIAPLPFRGPMAGIRVALVGDRLVANPTRGERATATMDLVISARPDGLVMVEGEAKEVPEKRLLEAFRFALDALQPLHELEQRWPDELGCERYAFSAPERDPEIVGLVRELTADSLEAALCVPGKHERRAALARLQERIMAEMLEAYPERQPEIAAAFSACVQETMREMIVIEGRRVDGRGLMDVRPIEIEVGWLPRAHGSALFTRGETQAIVTCTLGTESDAERVDSVFGYESHRFMLHYNFPPYSVGEIRPLRGPGRREIGHGNLALRALEPLLPDEEGFPYAIRVVSDISESNGSSSMATVCGGCLALMDAGVPLKKHVAGVAMGLIQEEDEIAVLTDILGDEDHLGDMDFKVAGTRDGVTAVQLDNKIGRLEFTVLERALEQARQARLQILEVMRSALPEPRPELSIHAPRAYVEYIRPERIRDLIGPGGRVIQDLQHRLNCKISVEDDGKVSVYAPDGATGSRALQEIRALVQDPEKGKVYRGRVVSIKDFGAFVRFLSNHEGLVHVSELAEHRVEHPRDVIAVGDELLIRVLDVEPNGRLRLSHRAAIGADESEIAG
jgi:polyribonucleotide nucleotidyltransferase